MIDNTLLVFGPGGIGKSPVDSLIRTDAVRIDPYRLRTSGPRDQKDVFYAHPNLRSQLAAAFEALGDRPERLSTAPAVDWFAKSRIALLEVRGEWQCLFVGTLSCAYAKAEIYAPSVPGLLMREDVRKAFGTLTIAILNPVASLDELGDDLTPLMEATLENCARRGDIQPSIDKRVNSIREEATAWRRMLDLGGTEYPKWPFPEYVYADNETGTLVAARSTLIAGNPVIERFLRSEAEIRSLENEAT